MVLSKPAPYATQSGTGGDVGAPVTITFSRRGDSAAIPMWYASGYPQ